MSDLQRDIRNALRDIPDFPKPGIIFKDITPLLGNAQLVRQIILALAELAANYQPGAIVAIESRGFIFGMPLAQALQLPFIPIRKLGKLPAETESVAYELEYGGAHLEIHKDALAPCFIKQVILIDDLLATGGTARAACQLIEKLGGEVAAALFPIELAFLKGAKQLEAHTLVHSLLAFD